MECRCGRTPESEHHRNSRPNYAEFLNPTTIAWGTSAGSFQLVGLNGQVKATIGGGSTVLDTHDFKLLPNGNYLGIEPVTRNCPAVPSQCVNLSSWGLSSQATIIDDDIVELTPAGQVVWRWDTANHINVANANVHWHDQFPDVIHMNSINYDGHGGDRVTAPDTSMPSTGSTWQPEPSPGSSEARRLHRVWPSPRRRIPPTSPASTTPTSCPTDRSPSHDDGTRASPARLPRALHIRLNLSSHTATIVKQVTDPRAQPALCCGSAILLPSGDWVASWGFNDYMTELSRSGVPQITITFKGLFSYRAELVDASVSGLRSGMEPFAFPSTCDLAVARGRPEVALLWRAGRPSVRRGRTRHRGRYRGMFQLIGGALLLLGTVTLVSTPPGSAAAATPFSMSTTPALSPAFSAKIADYAVRCPTKSTTRLVIQGTGQVTVEEDLARARSVWLLPLVAGQEVQVTFGTTSYYIRCLPSGFPKYSASVPGHPQAPGYLVDLGDERWPSTTAVSRWWKTGVSKPPDRDPDYSEFLNATTIAWGESNSSYKLVGLNGAVKGTIGWSIGAPRHPRPRAASQWGLSRVRAGHP